MLAGMAFVSVPKLVAAVCNAGGLGIYNSVATPPEKLKDVIKEIRSLTDKPFGMNVVMILPNARPNAEIALEEKVPVLNYALGKGDWIIQAAHEYGGKVISTVATDRHARGAEREGADAVAVTASEAAAHGGEVNSMVLIPMVTSQVKIPVIAAGGFCDGRGLAAAIAMGAEGVSMGTRFMASQESPAPDSIKEIVLRTQAEDTLRSDKIDGMPGRWLKTEDSIKMAAGKMSVAEAMKSASEVQKMTGIPWHKLIFGGLRQRKAQDLARQAVSVAAMNISMDTGLDARFLPMGQVAGRISDIPTVKEVIERVVTEAEEVIQSMQAKVLA
jgi:enoyl-[acyl-carrier protein] reductase II